MMTSSYWYKNYKLHYIFLEIPNCTGQVVVLTGGTRGIGLEILKKLLQAKFHVVIGKVWVYFFMDNNIHHL